MALNNLSNSVCKLSGARPRPSSATACGACALGGGSHFLKALDLKFDFSGVLTAGASNLHSPKLGAMLSAWQAWSATGRACVWAPALRVKRLESKVRVVQLLVLVSAGM